MSLTPMSKEVLQSLKNKLETENNTRIINNIITQIYNNVINNAKIKSDTIFEYNLSSINNLQIPYVKKLSPISKEFFIANITQILNGLIPLFPDCKVKHIVYATGQDNKLYDISNVPKTVKLNTTIENQDYIVIDWT